MTRVLNIIIAILALAACSSCSTVRHTSQNAPVATTVVSFTVADLDVAPGKVTSTYSWHWMPFRSPSIELIKTNTTALMLKERNADVLLEPQYIVEKRGFLRGGSVTVTGFPAKFKNFHVMTPEEARIYKDVKDAAPEKPRAKKFFIF